MKIIIGMPSYDGRIHAEVVDAILETKYLCKKYDIDVFPVFLCFDALIQRARNDLFQMAHQSECDGMIYIDSDTIWKPEDFLKFCFQNYYQKDIIIVPCPKKSYELKYNISCSEIPDTSQELVELDSGGCGFMWVSREAINKIYNAAEEYEEEHKTGKMVFNVGIEDGKLVSEDIKFCRDAKRLGLKVWLANNIELGHIGQTVYVGDFKKYIDQIKNSEIERNEN